jgi:hypothetical protein
MHWMQEVRRFKPSTVSRRMSVVTGFYRTCVIDTVLEHSPAEYVRRPMVPNESPTLGLSHLQLPSSTDRYRRLVCRSNFARRGVGYASSPSKSSDACRPTAPAQPGVAGMVQLFPSRRVVTDVRLSRPFCLLANRRLAPETTSRTEQAHPHTALPANWQIRAGGVEMFRPETVEIQRYRYRGTRIPTPWSPAATTTPAPST